MQCELSNGTVRVAHGCKFGPLRHQKPIVLGSSVPAVDRRRFQVRSIAEQVDELLQRIPIAHGARGTKRRIEIGV